MTAASSTPLIVTLADLDRTSVPCCHEGAERALPVRERLPTRPLRRTEPRPLVERSLRVDGIAAEERYVERGRNDEHQRSHRGGVELQVHLGRGCAVGGADHVE